MFIRMIEIDGVEENVTITHTDEGAAVRSALDGRVICTVGRHEPSESRFAKACQAAKLILGTDRHGRAAGTNSMLHEVMNEIDRVAGR